MGLRRRLLFSLLFGLWTQTTVKSFSRGERPRALLATSKCTNTSAVEEQEPGKKPGPGLVESSATVQHNVFISQSQLDASHFPSQWEGKRLSLQMGTKKLLLVHMAGQRRWESSCLSEAHNLLSDDQLDFSRAAEWWAASWSFTNKWQGDENLIVT